MNNKVISGSKRSKKGEPSAEEIKKEAAEKARLVEQKKIAFLTLKQQRRRDKIKRCNREFDQGVKNIWRGAAVGSLGIFAASSLNPLMIQLSFLKPILIFIGIIFVMIGLTDLFGSEFSRPG